MSASVDRFSPTCLAGGFRDFAAAFRRQRGGPRLATGLAASGASGLALGRSLKIFLDFSGGDPHDVDGTADNIR